MWRYLGGNVGNILKDPSCTIDHDHYWCIDVSRDAIEQGQRTFPEAHGVFYDRYNMTFNPSGMVGLEVPDTGQQFDFILAYSVFTHTSQAEMMELVNYLETVLTASGALAFTFIDPHYHPWPGSYQGTNLQWRLEKIQKTNPAVNVEALLAQAQHARWCLLVGDDELYIERDPILPHDGSEPTSCHTFYTAAYMQRLFPRAAVLPPVNAEMQHCCLIRKKPGPVG